jgi:hypothetical protein
VLLSKYNLYKKNMTEEKINEIKKKIEQKTSTPEETLELLKELNIYILKLNQELKDQRDLNNLQSKK